MKKRKKICNMIAFAGIYLGLLCNPLTAGDVKASDADVKGSTAKAAGGYEVYALADGNYAVDVELSSGGSGKASVETPTLMTAEDGRYFAQITWSSPNYDYMIVDGDRYENQSENGGNSSFWIPILAFDEDMPVIADTTAMGEPHEIRYTLRFYSDSVAPESSLPREGARRVLVMAAVIIAALGVLNHYTNQRRRRDF